MREDEEEEKEEEKEEERRRCGKDRRFFRMSPTSIEIMPPKRSKR